MKLKYPPFLVATALATQVLLWCGCSTVPMTGRSQLNFIPESQEMQLGLTSFEQLKKDVPINRDPAINALVKRVGQRVAAVVGKDLPNAQWEFVVFESPEANAFCLPGGKVGVYTGILPITKDEAGLATVIGHEVAHAAAHHGAERMSQAALLGIGGQIVDRAVANKSTQTQALTAATYGLGTQLGLALPHSRQQEAEADRMGLFYMARAGYDPAASVAFWERFAQYNAKAGANTPWFLRTHPLDQDRIKNLQQLLPQARQEYQPPK